jgi:hypothetical protein
VRENWCCTKESRLPCRTSVTSLRLVALVVLHLHTLKENILPGHRDFLVQHEFARIRHPLYLIIHTNNPPVGPICQSLSFLKLFHPSFSGLSLLSLLPPLLLCPTVQALLPPAVPPSRRWKEVLELARTQPRGSSLPLPPATSHPPPAYTDTEHGATSMVSKGDRDPLISLP